jgi:hypothetical protein
MTGRQMSPFASDDFGAQLAIPLLEAPAVQPIAGSVVR